VSPSGRARTTYGPEEQPLTFRAGPKLKLDMIYGVDAEQLHVLKAVRLFVASAGRARAANGPEEHTLAFRAGSPPGLDVRRRSRVENHEVVETTLLFVLPARWTHAFLREAGKMHARTL
jgi:hypothetical protein